MNARRPTEQGSSVAGKSHQGGTSAGNNQMFLDAQASQSVRRSVRHTFGFPFCQRRDDIVVADMVANMDVDKVADMVADKKMADM